MWRGLRTPKRLQGNRKRREEENLLEAKLASLDHECVTTLDVSTTANTYNDWYALASSHIVPDI